MENNVAAPVKVCWVCQNEKPLDCFSKDKQRGDGLCSKCKDCYKAAYNANREAEIRRVSQWNTFHPQRCVLHQREYYSKNKAVLTKRKLPYNRARRAKKARAEGRFTNAEWLALCEMAGNRCLACGRVCKLTADHIVPLSKGGRDSIDNIQCLCGPCNSRKSTKTIDYRQGLYQA